MRRELGMTMKELADRVGLSQAQVSRLETGKQGFRSLTLLRIAEALDVKPVFFFMDGADEEAPPYGLAMGGELTEALDSPEFVWLAQKLAKAYLHDKRGFKAVEAAAAAILG